MYFTVQCVVLCLVQCLVVLVAIYRKQGNGCSSLDKSAQPVTLMSGYSLLYSTVYSVQYSVHCTVQYRVGVWGVQVLSGM